MDASINFFKYTSVVIFALAFSEVFKQFVTDRDEPHIKWKRLPSLLSFLILIFPFYQGNSEYFLIAHSPSIDDPREPIHLMCDGFVFLCESGIFFVMSRSISPDQWHTFYRSAAILSIIDLAWCVVTLLTNHAIKNEVFEVWAVLNLVTAICCWGLLFCFKEVDIRVWSLPLWIGFTMMLVRSALDYGLNWTQFYFRSPEHILSLF